MEAVIRLAEGPTILHTRRIMEYIFAVLYIREESCVYTILFIQQIISNFIIKQKTLKQNNQVVWIV